jgi:hypothetical protein
MKLFNYFLFISCVFTFHSFFYGSATQKDIIAESYSNAAEKLKINVFDVLRLSCIDPDHIENVTKDDSIKPYICYTGTIPACAHSATPENGDSILVMNNAGSSITCKRWISRPGAFNFVAIPLNEIYFKILEDKYNRAHSS